MNTYTNSDMQYQYQLILFQNLRLFTKCFWFLWSILIIFVHIPFMIFCLLHENESEEHFCLKKELDSKTAQETTERVLYWTRRCTIFDFWFLKKFFLVPLIFLFYNRNCNYGYVTTRTRMHAMTSTQCWVFLTTQKYSVNMVEV